MKKIAIVGSSMGENSFGANKTYLEFISKFGDPRIIMPNDKLVDCDLLILPGGMDIHPNAYGQSPGFYTSNSDVFKQHFYNNNLKLYVEAKIPIFGICLGMQMINTFFGGTLIQHSLEHPDSDSRWKKAHKVLYTNEDFTDVRKSGSFDVNSHHHQLVTQSTISKELIPLLVAEDKENDEYVVEALQHITLPIIGIQWHSEEWYDNFSINAIKSLLK